MNASVRLVEQALEHLKEQNYDSFLSLLAADAVIGVNDDLPKQQAPDELRMLLADEQVLKYRVDGVISRGAVQVTMRVQKRSRIVGKGWVRSVFWVRDGGIERAQLGQLLVVGQAFVAHARWWPF